MTAVAVLMPLQPPDRAARRHSAMQNAAVRVALCVVKSQHNAPSRGVARSLGRACCYLQHRNWLHLETSVRRPEPLPASSAQPGQAAEGRWVPTRSASMEDRQLTYAEGLQDRESKKGGDRRLVKTAIAAGHRREGTASPLAHNWSQFSGIPSTLVVDKLERFCPEWQVASENQARIEAAPACNLCFIFVYTSTCCSSLIRSRCRLSLRR